MKNHLQYINRIICILLIAAQPGFAQLLKQTDSYIVYINYPDYTVKTSVSNNTGKIRVNEQLTYHWYASNRIMQTKGAYDGKLIDGLYTSFFLSNNLKEKGTFKNGLKNGKWISWYNSGKIDEITNWKYGKKSGEYKKFNPDESLNTIAHYKRDKLHGSFITYINGEEVSRTVYKNGKEAIKMKKMKSDSAAQKPSLKEKWNDLFKKKQPEKTGPIKSETPTKEKKTSPLFKKKEDKPVAKDENNTPVTDPKRTRSKKDTTRDPKKKKTETAQETNK